MDDLISRQAVIEIVENNHAHDITLIDGDAYTEGYRDGIKVKQSDILEDLAELPSVEPKRGKWIYGEDLIADSVDGYRCDQCGYFIPWDYTHKSIDYINDYNFCPNCGADMREVAT